MGQRGPSVNADQGLFAARGLHAGFELAASPDLFGWVMAALLLIFWEPSTPPARAG